MKTQRKKDNDIERDPEDFIMVTTPAFKLKDAPTHRRFQMIDLQKQFTAIPDVIIVEKVHGKSNTFVVRGLVHKNKIQLPDMARKIEIASPEEVSEITKKKKTP